jgi:hypothetical protein
MGKNIDIIWFLYGIHVILYYGFSLGYLLVHGIEEVSFKGLLKDSFIALLITQQGDHIWLDTHEVMVLGNPFW